MFDIGFSELLLVFVIGLIVLGPQRLPVAVKTLMGWIRAMRSLATSVQNELAQELKLQELQDSLAKVEKASVEQLTPELKSSMEELRHAAEAMRRSYKLPATASDLLNRLPQEQANTQPSEQQNMQSASAIASDEASATATTSTEPVTEAESVIKNASVTADQSANQSVTDQSVLSSVQPPVLSPVLSSVQPPVLSSVQPSVQQTKPSEQAQITTENIAENCILPSAASASVVSTDEASAGENNSQTSKA